MFVLVLWGNMEVIYLNRPVRLWLKVFWVFGFCFGSLHAVAQTVLKEVTVTGNPLGATELVTPVDTYSGTSLLLRSKSTLGETLDGTPGVSSTYFGPNASRPVIRGLDGDRVRILQNSGGSLDASGLSFDHALPTDPIAIERVEVLRGPGALLYGGNAVGGVVNVIDNRIPREALFDTKGGVTGKLDQSHATGNAETASAALVEAGNDRYALHADVFGRNAVNTTVPVSLPCTKPGSPALASAICNSQAQTRGGAVGGSLFFDRGYLGLSASTYQSIYGTVAEDDVVIDMKSNRYTLEGELRGLSGPLQSLKGQWTSSEYQHTELDAGVAGTVFKNAGNELRLQAKHANLGPLRGVVGLQVDSARFSADGAEAFAPHSKTDQTALFVYEELPMSWGRFSLGARVETVRVESMGNPIVPRFVPAVLNFNPGSYALGVLWDLAPAWQVTSNLSVSQRAPKDYELFADGPHIATNSYEVGNPGAALEKSTNLDIGVRWKSGVHNFGLSTYVNNFSNYLVLQGTGVTRDTDGNGAAGAGVTDDGSGNSVESGGTARILPEFVYTQVGARFTGLEAQGKVRLLDSRHKVDLELRADWVRAMNTSTGLPLPRIAPLRLGAGLIWEQGPWGARVDAKYVAAQNEVPPGDLPTVGYSLLGAALSYKQKAGTANLFWYARADNLGDVLVYSASSILTQTAPGKAPLPGRSFKFGVQAQF